MPRFTPPLTSNQQKAIAIIPKITASASILGSCYIVQHVALSNKRRKMVYHRLLLVMSAMDFVSSIKSFMSTWPIPRGTPGVYGAVGTTASCTAFGFIGHGSALSSALYNGSLTLFFLLTIRYGCSEERIKGRIEPWLHIVPLVVGWGTAVPGLPLLLYNPIGWTCWIGPWPLGCLDSHRHGYTTCVRGDNAWIYRWAFFHAELWAIFGFTLIAMYMIYRVVLKHEKKSDRYRKHRQRDISERKTSYKRERSKRFAHQASLYLLAYYITWVFPMIQWVMQQSRNKTYTPILMLQAFLVPLQGFFNVLIYMRPRYLRYRRHHPELSCWQVWKRAFQSTRRKETIWRISDDVIGPQASSGQALASSRSSMDSSRMSFMSTYMKRFSSIRIPRDDDINETSNAEQTEEEERVGRTEDEDSGNTTKKSVDEYDVFASVEFGANNAFPPSSEFPSTQEFSASAKREEDKDNDAASSMDEDESFDKDLE